MLEFLLRRPIAVFLTLFVSVTISSIVFFKLPVSLLPAIDVPVIHITLRYPDAAAEEIELSVLKPIRENMLTVGGLRRVESIAGSEIGKISLFFEHNTDMRLAYMEVSEKSDRLLSVLPRELERPVIVKSSTSDIPVIKMQIIPQDSVDFVLLSELSRKVLKRRLEQIEGVGLVDISGRQRNIIRITPDYGALRGLSLSEQAIFQAIQAVNIDFGAISISDGSYEFNLKLGSKIRSPELLRDLLIRLPNSGSVRLKQVARVEFERENPTGYHLFDTTESVVIAIHKQTHARLTELIPLLDECLNQFKEDYPELEFRMTQDQSKLLMLSIQNLSQALVLGGVCAFAVLFLFVRGWREPVIMGTVLPISLILAFSVFYLMDISLNIISLSGLALGLGMLVDNSIVVIDNIMLKRKEGRELAESCISGTSQVIIPLLSSALTNLAVFVPLIFISGLTGALFYDQAISVAAILGASLICTFILVPLLYFTLFKRHPEVCRQDSKLVLLLLRLYETSLNYLWQRKARSLVVMSALVPTAFALFLILPKQGFPEIERSETLIFIDWNEPIDVNVNRDRILEFITTNSEHFKLAESEVGIQQFMRKDNQNSLQKAEIYILYEGANQKESGDLVLQKYLKARYPEASVVLTPAPNPFDHVFSSSEPFFQARFRSLDSKRQVSAGSLSEVLDSLRKEEAFDLGQGFDTEIIACLQLDFDKLDVYEVPYEVLIKKVNVVFDEYLITDFKAFGEITPVRFARQKGDILQILSEQQVESSNGKSYPLESFIKLSMCDNFKRITADGSGVYQAIDFEHINNREEIERCFTNFAKLNGMVVDFHGRMLSDETSLHQILIIMVVSLLLMYFILTAEFESLKMPILVLVTIPMGFAGSLILLMICGGSVNIMSGIGLVVVLGVIDNDAILKIDRINRLRCSMTIEAAIRQAGIDRLKPIIMNTCTNVLAVLPIVFSEGLGADLQRPVAITTIGGLIVGTFTALYFVPISYWYLFKERNVTGQI